METNSSALALDAGRGRELRLGVEPRVLALPITATGVDEGPLEALCEAWDVMYLERTLIPVSREDVLGVYLLYLEVRARESDKQREIRESMEAREYALPTSPEVATRVKALFAWRDRVAKAIRKPHYVILSNEQLEAIATLNPKTLSQLKSVRGIGDKRLRQYGDSLLALLRGEDDKLTGALKRARDPKGVQEEESADE